MTKPTKRWRLGSRWLELDASVGENWFQTNRDAPSTEKYDEAVRTAAERIEALRPNADPEPARLSEHDLRKELGLGDGDVTALGPGGSVPPFFLRDRDYLLSSGALRVLIAEIDALADKCRDAARVARVQAYLLGVANPYPELGCHWEQRALDGLVHLVIELRELHAAFADNDESGPIYEWLHEVATTGLRSERGKQILLAIQNRGVGPTDMDAQNLDEVDLLAKAWPSVST